MDDSKDRTSIDLAGIRWLINEIENRAMERYLGSRQNIHAIVKILRDARRDLTGYHAEHNPAGLRDVEAECPWDWCPDGKCLPDCPPPRASRWP